MKNVIKKNINKLRIFNIFREIKRVKQSSITSIGAYTKRPRYCAVACAVVHETKMKQYISNELSLIIIEIVICYMGQCRCIYMCEQFFADHTVNWSCTVKHLDVIFVAGS